MIELATGPIRYKQHVREGVGVQDEMLSSRVRTLLQDWLTNKPCGLQGLNSALVDASSGESVSPLHTDVTDYVALLFGEILDLIALLSFPAPETLGHYHTSLTATGDEVTLLPIKSNSGKG